MFDFFKYVADEIRGVDTETIKKEKKEREEKEKANRIIFSKKAKIIICACAIMYILLTLATVTALRGSLAVTLILFYVLRMMIALGIVISILIGKKQGEITALIGIMIFFLLMFLGIALY